MPHYSLDREDAHKLVDRLYDSGSRMSAGVGYLGINISKDIDPEEAENLANFGGLEGRTNYREEVYLDKDYVDYLEASSDAYEQQKEQQSLLNKVAEATKEAKERGNLAAYYNEKAKKLKSNGEQEGDLA